MVWLSISGSEINGNKETNSSLSSRSEQANQITASCYFVKHFLFIGGWLELVSGSMQRHIGLPSLIKFGAGQWGEHQNGNHNLGMDVFGPGGKGESDFVCAWLLFPNLARKKVRKRRRKKKTQTFIPTQSLHLFWSKLWFARSAVVTGFTVWSFIMSAAQTL